MTLNELDYYWLKLHLFLYVRLLEGSPVRQVQFIYIIASPLFKGNIYCVNFISKKGAIQACCCCLQVV